MLGLLGISIVLHLAVRLDLSAGPHLRVVSRAGMAGIASASSGLVSDLSAILFAVALWRLSKGLGLIARGEYFTGPVVRDFRGFALFLLLSALTSALLPPFVALVLANHPIVMLDFRDVWAICVSAVLLLLARLMDEARRIDQDLAEIV